MSDTLLSDSDIGLGSSGPSLLSDEDVGLAAPVVKPQAAERNAMGPVLSTVDTAVRGAARAVPFMDDIAAAGDTAASYLPESVKGYVPGINPADQSGKPFGERYSENLARQRAINAADDTDRPITSIGSQVAGTFALPVGVAGKAIGAGAGPVVGALGRAATSGAVGAGYGAAYGAGQGTSLEDRLGRAETGALYGGAAGAVAPALVSGAANVVGAIAKPFKTILSPSNAAAERVGNAFARDAETGKAAGLSTTDAAEAASAGQPTVNADLGGETVRGLARSAANKSPEARAVLGDAVNERFASQNTRFGDFMRGLFASDLNSQTVRDQLATQARNVNTPAYQKAYRAGANGVWDEDLGHLLNAPDMKSAIADATRKGANSAVLNGQQVVKNPFVADELGNLALAKGPNGETAYPTLQFWDQVKRSLDDKITAARRSGNLEDARDFNGLKLALTSKLDSIVPDYADARLGAFKMFGAENALDAGEKFLGLTKTAPIDAMKASIGKMNPAQQNMFAYGLASQITQKAENASERRNIVNLFNSPETLDKLRLGLGPDRANQIEAYLRRESVMDQLRTAITGNSTTARQLAEQGMAGGKEGHGISGMISGALSSPILGAAAGAGAVYHEHGLDLPEMGKYAVVGALGGLLGKAWKNANEQTVRNVAQMLASDDPALVQKATQMVARNPQAMNALRRVEQGVTGTAAEQSGTRSEAPPLSVPVPMRADGGRVQPSEAQKEAGNYKKDHLSFQGLQIAIENAKGSTRSGTDHKGKPWKVRMPADYGYIKRTEGADGDHVDCYLGPNRDSDKAFIVDQRDERTQKFDEHKVMLGFLSRAQALHIYREGFSDGKGGRRLGGVTEMPIGDFKDWLKSTDLSKPAATVHRAAGGRVGDPAKRASHLEKQANRIRKAYGGELEPLMRVPDHVVAHALRST